MYMYIQKVTCMLEDFGLPYDAWYIDIMKGELNIYT
jgi:glutathione S-transferase